MNMRKYMGGFMKKSVFALAFSIVVLSLSPLIAFAESNLNYLNLKAGFYSPNGDLEQLNEAEFGTGFYGEIAIGRYILSGVAIEVGLGYFESDASERVSFIDGDFDVDVVPLLLSLKLFYTLPQIELFLAGGGGAYFTDFEARVDVPSLLKISDSDDDTIYGVHLGTGLNVNLTNSIFVGVEGRYIWTGEADIDIFDGASIDFDINGFTVTGNLGFRF
jgi:opacity protein-like surface antigen